mmetsp:Transcript_31336/g.56310  ORF Transcript_31336/g.56310 Transcript_31336/m.56310 type:complete len:84 (-) Transcript_31336:426-677(-)
MHLAACSMMKLIDSATRVCVLMASNSQAAASIFMLGGTEIVILPIGCMCVCLLVICNMNKHTDTINRFLVADSATGMVEWLEG